MNKRKKIEASRGNKRRKIKEVSLHDREGSNEEILEIEVNELLSKQLSQLETTETDVAATEDNNTDGQGSDPKQVLELFTPIEVEVVELSSTGDGLAYTPNKQGIVVIPFTVVGDTVRAKPYRWSGTHYLADLGEVIRPSPLREGVKPECKYFGTCSGCQLQMLPYPDQLKHKQKIVEQAFRHFSGLSDSQMPKVDATVGSPLQYGYRTKLSPHFDGPRRPKQTPSGRVFETVPNIGFNKKGTRHVMDIESCPIGTPILQEGLTLERAKVKDNLDSYKRGATILLREHTLRKPLPPDSAPQQVVDDSTTAATRDDVTTDPDSSAASITVQNYLAPLSSEVRYSSITKTPEMVLTFPNHIDIKTYTSDERSFSTELVGFDPANTTTFTNRAGSFFQNNNSILGPFTSYIYRNCIPKPSQPSSTSDPSTTTAPSSPSTSSSSSPIKFLLDAYCGSGLFAVTLARLFTSTLGIDVDARAIEAARHNAQANNLSETAAGFIDADAADLFADVPFPPAQTLCVIDPPRKGASMDFLRQMMKFGPKRVVYVSCNVHSQARDVGILVNGLAGVIEDGDGWRYKIEKLRGFDFFPQTGHVEGVCFLDRVEKGEDV